MSLNLRRAFRFGRAWLRESADLVAEERLLSSPDGPIPATLLLPGAPRGPLPAWIVLHGITRPGRAHPMLVRFARALAASGNAVLVPEVAEWVALSLAPHRTVPVVRAALDALAADPAVRGPVGLVGFSFGAPQALMASAHPDLASRLAGGVGFGGYSDLARTVRFQMSGVHEWNGETLRARPDPYGRWIVAGNYLHRVPGCDALADVSATLLELARISGEARTPAWDPVYDAPKERLRASLARERRGVFDFFAPPSAHDPPEDDARVTGWVERIAETARAADPLLDPLADVERLPRPVHVLHGRADSLIPFTEGLRLAERLSGRGEVRTTLTGLFTHSSEHPLRELPLRARESATFAGALARILGMV